MTANDMKMLRAYPPNIEEIRKHVTPVRGTVYTYGTTIYNPDGAFIDEFLEVHEGTHMLQQGEDPASWWKRWCEDKDFRMEQEAQAYRNQYQAFTKKIADREERARYLLRLAFDLSGANYGRQITTSEAAKLIRA